MCLIQPFLRKKGVETISTLLLCRSKNNIKPPAIVLDLKNVILFFKKTLEYILIIVYNEDVY